jgi:type II secretory pathway component PulM
MSLQTLKDSFRSQSLRSILVLVAAVMLINIGYRALWQPIVQKRQQLTALVSQINERQVLISQAKASAAELHETQSLCLSDDPAVVLHRYQQWLLKRSESLSQVTVSAGTITAEEPLGWRVKIDIEGTATLDWLTTFIDEAENTPLLHRISYLNIHREEKQNDGTIQFACSLEALVCHGAITMSEWPAAEMSPSSKSLASFLKSNRLFERGYTGEPQKQLVAKRPTEKSATPSSPPVDPLVTVKFVGSVVVNGQPLAWLVDSRTQRETFLALNSRLELPPIDGEILEISREYLRVRLPERELRWPLGDNLRVTLNAP